MGINKPGKWKAVLHYAMNNSLKHANSESVNNFSVGTAEAPHKNSEYFLKDNDTMVFSALLWNLRNVFVLNFVIVKNLNNC